MPAITPIQPHQTTEAKRLIYRVAKVIFADPRPLEEMISQLEAEQRITLAALAKALGGGWSGK